MTTLPEQSVAAFNNGSNCAEAILSTYAPRFRLDQSTAYRLASGLGGGMGRMAQICGAVSAAYLVLGLRFGRSNPADSNAREIAYAKVRDFSQQFEEKYGSLFCRDLLGCDISTDEGRKIAKDKNLFQEICPACVQTAATILDSMI